MTYSQFMSLFTDDENQAVLLAARQNYGVFGWLLELAGAKEIELDGPLVTVGLTALVRVGLLTAERQAQIQAGTPAA